MKSRSAELSAKPTRRAKRPPLLKIIAEALAEKKAGNVRILVVEKLSSITNYLVLATATSEPHLRALRIEMERVFSDNNAKVLGLDTSSGSGWAIIDGIDIMVHLFLPEMRAKYQLEALWKDAPIYRHSLLLRAQGNRDARQNTGHVTDRPDDAGPR